MLKFYNICSNPDELSDEEWALKYNILLKIIEEDITASFKKFGV